MRNLSAADLALIEQIKELKSLHPFFGYRRIWAHLKFRDGLNLNKKKVYRWQCPPFLRHSLPLQIDEIPA